MKREKLKEILTGAGITEEKTKEVIDAIFLEHGKDITAEKDKLAAKENELSTANQTIKDLRATVDSFGGQTPEELRTQLGNLQKKYDDDINAEKKKYADLLKGHALKESLSNLGVLDPDYLIYKQGGIDKFAFADDKPVGLDDIVKPYKETNPSLFKVETQIKTGMRHEGGGTVKEGSDYAEANNALRSLFGKE